MKILVRTAKHNEQDKIKEFYTRAYPEEWKYKVDEYFQWLYTEAPHINNDNTTLYIAVDEENNEVVGQSGVFTQRFSFKSKIYNVAWGTDLFVLPEYRGNQIAQKLHTQIRDDFDFYIAVSYAFTTGKMLKRIGGIELDALYTYVLPLKMSKEESYKVFSRRMRLHPIGKYLKIIYQGNFFKWLYHQSGYWKLLNNTIKKRNSSSGQLNLIASEMSILDRNILDQMAFFQTESFDAFPIFESDQSEWRFNKHPKKQYRFCSLKREDGKVCGISIYRLTSNPEGNYAIVSVLYAEKEEYKSNLLEALIAEISKTNTQAIFFCQSNGVELKSLKKLGFKLINQRIPIIIPREKKDIQLLNSIKTWDFNFESQDLDFYPNLRLL